MTTKKEQIIPLLEAMNDTNLAQHVGCSREFVRQVREECGIENPFYYMRACTIWDEENTSEFIKLANQGMTSKQISEIMGIHRNTILTKAKEIGFKLRIPPKKIKFTDEELIEAYNKCNGHMTEASKIIGCSVTYACMKLNSLGYKGNGPRGRRAGNSKYNFDEIRKLISNGYKARDIATKLNITYPAAYDLIKRANKINSKLVQHGKTGELAVEKEK